MITINGGSIHLVSSDDGINVAGGMDGSGGMQPGGRPGGQTASTYTGSYYLYIRGGTIVVTANGDGLDVNGAIEMSGGVVLVNGPTEQMNGAIDYDATFKLTGGFPGGCGQFWAWAMAPGATSSQNSALIYLTSAQAAGTLVHIQDSIGKEILTFAPARAYQSLAFSAPAGEGHHLHRFYRRQIDRYRDRRAVSGWDVLAGTNAATFTVAGVVTTVGSGGRAGRP